MNATIIKIEERIREYLLEEGSLRKRINDPKLEFGFQFVFPPIPESVPQKGQSMVVYQPKNKNMLIISIGTQISPPQVEALNQLNEKKMNFFMDLKKLFLLKNIFFRIDIQNHRYEISDQIFLEEDVNFTKNMFYSSIRKVFNIQAYSNLLLMEYCAGKLKPEDFDKSKLDSSPGFSLYS